MNFTILGCGRWGSCIGWHLNNTGHKVVMWGLESDPYVQNFFATRKNDYLELPKEIETTFDLKYAMNKSDYVVISISTQHVRDLMQNVKKIDGYEKKNYILCMKGVEATTGLRLSQILIEFGVDKNHIATWVGPGHVQDFLRGIPGAMVIDSYNQNLSKFLIENLNSELIRFYRANDMIGTEIGAAAKNVIGIAAGILDGLGYTSAKGALMARGAYEVAKLIVGLGGDKLSAYGLCHLGDYEATLFSPYSHNHAYGKSFVEGKPFTKLAEGVATTTALLLLAHKHKIDMPITEAVNKIINLGESPKNALVELLKRPPTDEFVF